MVKLDIALITCTDELFNLTVKLDKAWIISRLKCNQWMPPPTFKSRLPSLCHSLQQALKTISRASIHHKSELEPVRQKMQHLATLVDRMDREGPLDVHESLKAIVRTAGALVEGDVSLEQFVNRMNIWTTEGNQKAIRAFDKVGNYWHLCHRLSRIAASRRYRDLLASIDLEFLEHYEKHRIYGVNRYVHAEVQFAIFHRQRTTNLNPRVIGTSKAACYLCDLFLI